MKQKQTPFLCKNDFLLSSSKQDVFSQIFVLFIFAVMAIKI